MKTYRAYDIDWDTDGEEVDLPTEATIELDEWQDINEDGANILSDEYGWCVFGFSFEEIKQ